MAKQLSERCAGFTPPPKRRGTPKVQRVRDPRLVGGFTILEVLLSVVILGIIGSIAVPVYQTLQVKNDLEVAKNTTTQALHRAQILAQAVDGDTSWGVKIQSGNITLFKGVSYASRDTNYDETFDVPTSITPSGLGEVVFGKFSGDPQATGTIIFTATTAEAQTITINAKGVVTY